MIGRGVEVVVESMKLLPSEGRGRKMRLFLMLMAVGAAISCTPVKSEVRGSNLREIIEDQIRKNVRESYGELAGENFSWDDLEQFHRNKVPEKIGNLLRASVRFRAAVDEVRSMVAADRDSYLRRCRLPLRRTWAELGKISPRGTTEAGQIAEAEIAKVAVDQALEMLAVGRGAPPGGRLLGCARSLRPQEGRPFLSALA